MAFNVRLRKFFQQNDPHRLYLVKKIVVAFREDEDLIMERLEQIYKDGGPSKLQSKSTPKAAFSYNDSSADNTSNSDHSNENDGQSIIHGDDGNSNDDSTQSSGAPKKSKKKLIIILLLLIVLAGGGYVGFEFFIKEKSSTEQTDDQKNEEQEEVTENETVTEETVEEPQPAVVADTLADSLQIPIDTLTVPADSTQNLDAVEVDDNE